MTAMSGSSAPLQNTEVYTGTNGVATPVDQGAYVVSSSGTFPNLSIVVNTAVSIPTGTTIGFGIENLLPASPGTGHVNLGSGATQNVNTFDNSQIIGIGSGAGSFGYTPTCNGAVPSS